MTIEWPVGANQAQKRDDILTFLKTRAAIKVLVTHVGAGLSFDQTPLNVGDELAVGSVETSLANAKTSDGRSDRKLILRPIYAPSFAEGDPGTFTYKIMAMHEPSELEWWHLELRPETDDLFWDDYATLWGLDGTVLRSPGSPNKDKAPPEIPWMGGADMKRSNNTAKRGTEPKNLPGKELVK
jgi:hypothetical protein